MNSWVAEGARVGSPFSKADCNHVGNDAADINLLRRVIVGTGVVASDRHRPGCMTGMQAGQETGGVVDILVRVEHVVHAAKVFRVVVMIDLHAAKIDQFPTLPPSCRKRGKGLAAVFGKNGFSFYIQSIRLQAAFLARFG